MAYTREYEKEDTSVDFSDDGSSTEEELLQIAEKLEKESHEEEEVAQRKTIILEGNGRNDRFCYSNSISATTSSNRASQSSKITSASNKMKMRREKIAKDVDTSANDNYIDVTNKTTVEGYNHQKKSVHIFRDGKEERKGLRQQQRQQQIEHRIFCSGKDQDEVVATVNDTMVHRPISRKDVSINDNNTEKNIDEYQMEVRHGSRYTQTREEKKPLRPSKKQPTDESVKITVCENKKTDHSERDKGVIDGDKSVIDRENALKEHANEKEEQQQVIVDLTKMESSSSPSSSDYASNLSEITNQNDFRTALFSSLSSPSERPLTDKTVLDISCYKNQLDSSAAKIINTTLDDTKMMKNVTTHTHGSKSKNQSKMTKCSSTIAIGVAPTNNKHCKARNSSPLRVGRSTARLRNPYLRKANVTTESTNKAESMATDIEETTTVVGDDSDNDMKLRTLGSEVSGKTLASRTTNYSTKIECEETIVIDRQELEEEPESEIPRTFYAPPQYDEGQPSPVLQRFDCNSQPFDRRQTIPVHSLHRIFASTIINSLWSLKFKNFNHFQSVMVNVLSDSDDNVVVSAPTGAGKSTIFEMAMARFLTIDLKSQEQQGKPSNPTRSPRISKARKMVYIAPSKALCEERYRDWSQCFERMNLGLKVALITGSEDASEAFPNLIAAHLIVTTPEKWDSMTRRWNESFFLFASVKLLLLDEVHLLGDESRGWCLESIVTRMKTIQRAASALVTTHLKISHSSYTTTNPDAIRSCFRMVAVSATLTNILEVAEFLRANEAYTFDDSYRPVPLTKHVNALGRIGNNEWRFWSNLSEHVPEIVHRFSHGKQCLIFCHSKKETQKVTELLIRRNFGNKGIRVVDPPWNQPVDYMLAHGVGYHHAGLNKDDRKAIEDAFLQKKIKYLAATSTLAVGVNLPAHLVIILGTKAWRNNEKGKGYQDIEASELIQMVGRAGRPGLDSTGVAVILTDTNSKNRIEQLLDAGIGVVESNLITRLSEVLNTEISQRVITNRDEILRWLQTTFLYCCLRKNSDTIAPMRRIGSNALSSLSDIGLVEISELESIRPLAGSYIMNKNLVSLEEMKSIAALEYNASQVQILRSMSKLGRLQSFVKRNEKRELKEFHKSNSMKYKLPGPLSKFIVRDQSEKAFILLQSHISRHKYKNEMLNDEQMTVRDEAIKILEVAQEYCIKASKHGKVALECYKLQRSINYSLWGESSGVFNQFEWIGCSEVASNILAFHGIRSFEDVMELSDQKLDEIFAKTQIPDLPRNAGHIVKHTARDLCRQRLTLSGVIESTKNSNIPTDFICYLKYHDHIGSMIRESREQDLKFSLIAYTDNSVASSLIFEENICSPSSFRIPLPSYSFQKLFIHLVGTWVGFDDKLEFDVMVGKQKQLKEISLQDDAPKGANSKKRKNWQTDTSHQIYQRRDEKPDWTAENKVKKPSPITPQAKDQVSGTFHSRLNAACKNVESTTPRSLDHSIPFMKQIAQNSSISVNITPTTHFPGGGSLRDRQDSICANARGKSHFYPSSTITESKEISGPEICIRQNGTRQSRMQHESSTIDTITEQPENVQHRNLQRESERTRRSRVVTGRVGIRSVDYSPPNTFKVVNSEKHVWNRSRTKQQSAQKRAFTEKKMNPFGAFSHDPNDFESHLEHLSKQSSIIPNPLLAKMKQSSIPSNRKSQRHFSTDENRPAKTTRYRPLSENPRQILMKKACEHQLQQKMYSQSEILPMNMSHDHQGQKDRYVSQPVLPENTMQNCIGSFHNPCGRLDYQMRCPQNFDNNFQFYHSSVPSGTRHFSGTEDDLSPHDTYVQSYDGKSSYISSPIQGLGSREQYQPLKSDSSRCSMINGAIRPQHQFLERDQQHHHQILFNGDADIERDFNSLF